MKGTGRRTIWEEEECVDTTENGRDAFETADLVLETAVFPHEGGEDEDAEFFEVAPFKVGGFVVEGGGVGCW